MPAILAVSFAAVSYTKNANCLAVQFEADAVVANPQAILGRVDALESFHTAGARAGETLNGLFNPAGDSFVERRHVFQRRLGPLDLSHAGPVTLIPTGAWLLHAESPCRRGG
jgi:hypothetical protein